MAIKITILRGEKTIANPKVASEIFIFLLVRVFKFNYSYQMLEKKRPAADIITINEVGINWDEASVKEEFKKLLESLGLKFKIE